MAFETQSGRQPISIVEIDQDLCINEYGIAPCTAAIGVTGTQKCFRVNVSCQDTDHFDRDGGDSILTLRFCTAAENLPRDVTLMPSIVDLTSAPTELNIGSGNLNQSPLGTRASVNITLRDHPHHDRGVDPYASERAYDALTQGTFWSKWLRRNPYYQGRELRVLDGYIGQPLAEMRTRTYIIEKIEGPTKGVVKITAKDPIKTFDSKRAQYPLPTGATLAVPIERPNEDAFGTDVFVSLPVLLSPSGIGATLDASGAVAIGSELFRFTSNGTDTVTLTQRMVRNTKGSEHKIGDAVQQVGMLSGSADEVIADLALNYVPGFKVAYIDQDEWAEEALLWAPSLLVERWVTAPTGVGQLIGGIVQQVLCQIWWELTERKLKFKVLRPRIDGIDDEPTPVNDRAHFIADSVSIVDKPDERITRVNVYYGKIDPTQGNDAANFAQFKTRADEDAESAEEYGEQRIVEIFADWLGPSSGGAAHALAVRLVKRYRDTPKLITVSVDAKDRSIQAAEFLALTHHALVDLSGAPEERIVQVVSVDDVVPGHKTELQARISENVTTGLGFIMDNAAPVYTSATDEQKSFGCWIADADGLLSNGDAGYRII